MLRAFGVAAALGLLVAAVAAAGATTRKGAVAAATAANTAPEVQPEVLRSLQWWEKSLSESPSAKGMRERCLLLGMANDVEAELRCWEFGLEHHAAELDSVDTRNAMAMCHRRLGQHKAAAQAFSAALRHEPRRPDLLLQLGLTLQVSGGAPVAARRKYLDALALAAEPEEAPALLLALATVDLQLGHLEEAAATYSRATGDAAEGNPALWRGAGRPGFAGSVRLLGGSTFLPPADEEAEDVSHTHDGGGAYPSATATLGTDGTDGTAGTPVEALSKGQWTWLKMHRNAVAEKWRARQQPESCATADVLVVELGQKTPDPLR